MKTTFFITFFSICLLFLAQNGFAQDNVEIDLFEMEYEGEPVQVTQSVDSHILGTYMQQEGKNTKIYQLGTAGEESFILTQFPKDPFEKKNQKEIKQEIQWGILTANGQPAFLRVQEFEDGKMKTYKGLVVIIQDLKTEQYRELLLYEANGKLVLGGIATKVSTMVSN
jgi:hypothetical protein